MNVEGSVLAITARIPRKLSKNAVDFLVDVMSRLSVMRDVVIIVSVVTPCFSHD